jgi:adenine-specific DNA-methyltransferase
MSGPTVHLNGAEVGDCIAAFDVADATDTGLADASVDVVIGSPPYLAARTYGIEAQRDMDAWTAFMLSCTREALRVSKGAVIWVVAGTTEDGNYTPGPENLLAEAWKAGLNLWRPLCWYKVDERTGGGCGQPGSGGRQWFRSDWEYALCFKRPGPLPWSDPRFQCRPPKCAPGGKIRTRRQDGGRSPRAFAQPTWVNPGNVVKARVGGGHMGDKECCENEAPYPEKLAAFLIQSLCPPGGWAYDPFNGSGTTVLEAVRHGRNGYGTDLRADQLALSMRRLNRRIVEGRAQAISPWPRIDPRRPAYREAA